MDLHECCRRVVVPPLCGPPTVSLALLLDFAIHQTIHELQVLSELNLKKKPEDRKISVVQFAHSTRLIFVRLLAIVRWLKSNRKFEPLSSIRFLLDEQAARYVETADKLVEIARNELPNARLSVFHVPQAVDVLTLGTYPRLPWNIKDRFVSTPPLAGREQRLTLRQLNHVLEFHLAQNARQLSPRIEQIYIKNGTVTLTVPNEFEIVLTRLGDDVQLTKWCLLNLKILVSNADVGNGQKLVHPLQLNFLHQLVQERLDNGEKPLFDVYNLLHTFSRSLQLDVLYCQATLIAKISSLYIRVEEYNTKECKLVIAYWLGDIPQPQQIQNKYFKNKKQIHHYRFTIYGDKTDPNSSLRVKHHPAGSELPKIDQSFSLQRLLNETIFFRCRERLLQTKRLLEQAQSKQTATIAQSGHCLLSLSYPLILDDKCLPAESLIIFPNTFFGTVNCRIEALGRQEEIIELEKQLNEPNPSLKIISRLLDRLRVQLLIERLQRAIVGLQVRKLNDNQCLPLTNKLTNIPADRSIFQFIREDQFYLIIAFTPDDQIGIKIQFYLFSSAEGRLTMLDLDAEQIIRSAPLPRLYASSLIALNSKHVSSTQENSKTFMASNSSIPTKREATESVDDLRNETTGINSKNAKVIKEEEVDNEIVAVENQNKTEKEGDEQTNSDEDVLSPTTSWLGTNRHLQAAIAAIDDRLLFLRVCEELEGRGIRYESVSVEPFVGGYLLRLIDVSSIFNKYNIDSGDFFQNLERCNIRMVLPEGNCQLECVFINPPLVQDFNRTEEEVEADRQKPHTWVLPVGNQRPRDMPSHGLVIAHGIEDRLLTYFHIYSPIRKFEAAYNSYYKNYCNVRAFTYHKLVLSYGGEHSDLLFILSWRWSWLTKTGKYALCFGQTPLTKRKNGQNISQQQRRWNPHVLVSRLLTERFNNNNDLIWLVNYLVNTHRSLGIIYQFVRTQMRSTKIASQVFGTEANFPAEMMFHLNPVDEYCIRLSYGPKIAMEFLLLQDNQVAVRDCSVGVGDVNYEGVTLSDFWRSFQSQNLSDEQAEISDASTILVEE